MGTRSQLGMFKPSTGRLSWRPFHLTPKLPATVRRSQLKRYSRKAHARRVLTINKSLPGAAYWKRTSGFGTFETCRRTVTMSVDRGRAEVVAKPTRMTHMRHL